MKKILSGLLTVCLLVSMLAVTGMPIKAEAASTSGKFGTENLTASEEISKWKILEPLREFCK